MAGCWRRCLAQGTYRVGPHPHRGGDQTLPLLDRREQWFEFEVGRPELIAERFALTLSKDPGEVTRLQVGNTQ